jgi:hypothetical protein
MTRATSSHHKGIVASATRFGLLPKLKAFASGAENKRLASNQREAQGLSRAVGVSDQSDQLSGKTMTSYQSLT